MAAAIAARSNFGNVGPPTSLTLTFGAGVSSANSIIVALVVLNRNADPTSVTDNGTGNTYTFSGLPSILATLPANYSSSDFTGSLP